MDISGRTAVITGAASGQGLASARRFARAGGKLALLDWNAAGGRAAAEELARDSAAAEFFQVDLSDAAAVEDTCARVLGHFGHVDILFNNAGVGYSEGHRFKMATIFETSLEDWNAILAINLTGAFLMTKFLGRSMMERRSGSIINNVSVAGLVGVPGIDAYTASKGALIALTRSLAATLGPYGIRVNAIAPGSIATPMLQPVLDSGGADERMAAIPLQRVGQPEEIAELALFLASDASSYLTGQIVAADGGRTAV